MPRQKGQADVERRGEMLEELKIDYVFVDDLIPNDYNPNRQNDHEFDLLCRSINEDGFTQPIIVGMDGHIVDGEHRWRAARAVGLEKVPIVRVPMEAAQARIATLRHNRARGSEDVEMSVAVLRDLEKLGALDWAAESLAIDDAELQRLLEDVPAPEMLANEEYSNAWMPGVKGDRDSESSDGTEQKSLTAEASDRLREQEKRLREAKSEEERETIRRERTTFRVALTFTEDEAILVKEVLGNQPAARLLELCKAEIAKRAVATS